MGFQRGGPEMCCAHQIAIKNRLVHQNAVGRCIKNYMKWQTRREIINRDCTFLSEWCRTEPVGTELFVRCCAKICDFRQSHDLRAPQASVLRFPNVLSQSRSSITSFVKNIQISSKSKKCSAKWELQIYSKEKL